MKENAGQSGAVKECTIPDIGDSVAYDDGGQALASIERTVSDAGDAIANSDAC